MFAVKEMVRCYIGLGANLPWQNLAPLGTMDRALAALGTAIGAGGPAVRSRVYRSAAWPDPSAPAYVNAVASVETRMPAHAVLAALLAMEAGFGRLRSDDPAVRYAPRTLDLDLLLYGDQIIDTPALQVPHPQLHLRDFVLRPLAELAADGIVPGHPTLGTLADIAAQLPAGGATPLPFVGPQGG